MLECQTTLLLVMWGLSGQILHSTPQQILQKAHPKEKIGQTQKVENALIVLQPQPPYGEGMVMVTTSAMHVASITK
jgi:hypothetical protein